MIFFDIFKQKRAWVILISEVAVSLNNSFQFKINLKFYVKAVNICLFALVGESEREEKGGLGGDHQGGGHTGHHHTWSNKLLIEDWQPHRA